MKATSVPPQMFAETTVVDEILELKKRRRAILLAHHYQEPEIQELADVIATAWNCPGKRAITKATSSPSAACGSWRKPPRY